MTKIFVTDRAGIEHEIAAEVLGYVKNIRGVFDLKTNLLNFDKLDYVPFFQVPKLIIKESIDLKNWRKVTLVEQSPIEYNWPQELTLEIKAKLRDSAYYIVEIEEN